MLNKILLCGLFLVLTLRAPAQKFDPEKMHYFINAGFNVSWFDNDVGVFNKTYPGYATSQYAQFERYVRISALVNFAVDYQLGPKFWVAGGLAYSGRGGAYQTKVKATTVKNSDDSDVDADNVFNYKIDYIEMPLLAQYNLSKPSSETSYVIYGGIAPAVRVGAATRYIYYPEDNPTVNISDTKVKTGGLTNVNVFNLHPILGLIYGDSRDKNHFFFDLRFEMSALPVFKNSFNYFDTQMWSGSIGFGLRGSIIPYRR